LRESGAERVKDRLFAHTERAFSGVDERSAHTN
jgi:hypothetical protein